MFDSIKDWTKRKLNFVALSIFIVSLIWTIIWVIFSVYNKETSINGVNAMKCNATKYKMLNTLTIILVVLQVIYTIPKRLEKISKSIKSV